MSDQFLDRAEVIIERYIGHELKMNTYSKKLRYDSEGACLQEPNVLEVLAVKAKASNWVFNNFFGDTDWVDVSLADVVIHTKDGALYLHIPPTMFGTAYSEIEVTYTAGYSDVPSDIIKSIREVADLLRSGQITEWNCILPAHVHDVIKKYRKEVID